MYYAIIDIAHLDSLDFSELLTDSKNTVRKSIDGSKFVVKYEGSIPSSISSISPIPIELSYAEVVNTTSTSEWIEEDELDSV